MKNILKIFFSFLFCVCSFFTVQAQITVVRVTGNQIYLDTSSFPASIRKGDLFKIILSSEKLINPQTGKDLGPVYTYSSEGKITEVQPLYAIGILNGNEKISVGQTAVIETTASAPQTDTVADTPRAVPASRRKLIRYNPVEQNIISLTEGLIEGKKQLITLSEDGKITVWNRGEDKNLTEVMSYKLPTGKKALSLSAKNINGGEDDQLFVSVYSSTKEEISTLILSPASHEITQIGTLNYFVKELGCGDDKKLWAQRPFILETRPGNAREVIFKKNKFTVGENSFPTQNNWLGNLNRFPIQSEDTANLIFTSSGGSVRMILKNGKYAESTGDFAQAPKRISFKNKTVRFYPSIQVIGTAGNGTIAVVEHTAKIGLLSDTFGQYKDGRIHWLVYEQGHLQDTEITDLNGLIYDTACTDKAVIAAEVLPDGTSTVVEILK